MLEASRSSHFARTSLTGWLYRIAHNLVIDYFRSHMKEETLYADEPLPIHGEILGAAEQLEC
jgi:DNA-directed RNA polymerase specialized sigma24 family protein